MGKLGRDKPNDHHSRTEAPDQEKPRTTKRSPCPLEPAQSAASLSTRCKSCSSCRRRGVGRAAYFLMPRKVCRARFSGRPTTRRLSICGFTISATTAHRGCSKPAGQLSALRLLPVIATETCCGATRSLGPKIFTATIERRGQRPGGGVPRGARHVLNGLPAPGKSAFGANRKANRLGRLKMTRSRTGLAASGLSHDPIGLHRRAAP